MKYTGPPKPLRTSAYNIHPVGKRVGKALFLIAIIAVLLMDLFYWRPG